MSAVQEIRPTILLAEDNPDDVLIFKRAFKQSGLAHTLIVAENGQEAIDYLQERSSFADHEAGRLPSLILLDLKMPLRTGFDVLDWLRNHETMRSIPAVILSSSDEQADVDRAVLLGARAYLVKPPTPRKLRDLVESLTVSGES